jgi:hypothetical protein
MNKTGIQKNGNDGGAVPPLPGGAVVITASYDRLSSSRCLALNSLKLMQRMTGTACVY